MPDLGGSQISALLESVPGIASVLRSPVADALVNMIRAGAGLRDFAEVDARELVQYAVRRGLISADEGEQVLAEVAEAARSKKARARSSKKPASTKSGTARKTSKKSARKKSAPAKSGGKRTKRR